MRSRVPIRGGTGKSILTGQSQTVVQQTIVQQVAKGGTSGVGTVASTIWPLIQQIPVNVVDIAALATPGLVVDTGSHIIARTLAVNAPLTIADPTGAGGNPTISLTTAALTKTDDTNVTLTLGGTPASALVAAASIAVGWTGQLAVSRGGTGNSALAALTKTDDTNVTLTLGGTPATALVNAASITVGWTGTLAVSRGGSGAATLTGYLKGNGTSAFTANATIPTTDITGLAAIATSGSASDLITGTVPSAQLPTASTSVLGAVKVDGTTITISGGVISSTGGGGTGANPTAVVGLAAVNGSATTFLRSDGSPALDQGIAPTWTGAHTFTPGSSVTAVTINSVTDGITINGGSSAQIRLISSAGASQAAYVFWKGTDAGSAFQNFYTGVNCFSSDGSFDIATSTATAINIGITGAVSIAAPTSGATLTVNGLQGPNTKFQGPNTGPGWNVQFTDTTNSAVRGFIGLGTNTVGGAAITDFAISPGASGSVVIGTANGVAIGTIFAAGGNVTVNAPTSGVPLSVAAGAGGTYTAFDSTNANGAYILLTHSGTNAAFIGHGATTITGASLNDAAMAGATSGGVVLGTANGNAIAFKVSAAGLLSGLGPVNTGLVDMTPDASTFTGTLTGMTATVTNTCRWSRNGNQVTLVIGAASGTSNTTAFTMTGLPAAIQPAHTQQASMTSAGVFTNAGANVQGNAQVTASSGTITFSTVAGPWSNTLSKGVASDFVITYLLN